VKRKQGNQDVLEGKETFRDSFKAMMDSIPKPYDECIKFVVDNIDMDTHFKEFLSYTMANNIPVVVLSSGMVPIIQAMLNKLVGDDSKTIDVIANDVVARPGKDINEEHGWEIIFHDDSGFGHDKSLTIRPYAEIPPESRPTLFYAGDGVSDLSAAKETDLLFAKKGRDLVTYCVREDIPFTLFEDWTTILEKTKEIVEGKTTVHDAAHEGYEAYKKGEAGVAV
jgi:2,3-diketo-5-methylthio-1-phosphopentane phosphatase